MCDLADADFGGDGDQSEPFPGILNHPNLAAALSAPILAQAAVCHSCRRTEQQNGRELRR